VRAYTKEINKLLLTALASRLTPALSQREREIIAPSLTVGLLILAVHSAIL